MTNQSEATTSIVQKEVEQFSSHANSWWDESGPFRPLHKMNPARLIYIKEQICSHLGKDFEDKDAIKEINILDIGCGGGLISEPLVKMGAKLTAIDASEKNIEIAKQHREKIGIAKSQLSYKATTAEDLLTNTKKRYDVVLALEIVEHVADTQFFVDTCAKLVKKDGIVIFSTLNKTAKSFALGIVAAEYIMRWLPKGTHSWNKFLKPSELATYCINSDISPIDITGMKYKPISDEFCLDKEDIAINYFMTCTKQ